ncbi:MAG: hypothetical protein JXB85_13730 [Anaerolineales bacterium]|nr:hypothetical protein [Anaerolineales bacterium]
MTDEKKKIHRMATWTITIFATVFSVVIATLWLIVYPVAETPLQGILIAIGSGWPIYVSVGLFCIATFIAYRLYLNRKK